MSDALSSVPYARPAGTYQQTTATATPFPEQAYSKTEGHCSPPRKGQHNSKRVSVNAYDVELPLRRRLLDKTLYQSATARQHAADARHKPPPRAKSAQGRTILLYSKERLLPPGASPGYISLLYGINHQHTAYVAHSPERAQDNHNFVIV